MVEELIRNTLKNDADIAALVADRIFPLPIPEKCKMPSITVDEITGAELYSHDGPSNYSKALFQVVAWAETRDQALEVRKRVKAIFSGARGLIGNDVEIQGAFVQDSRASFEGDPRPLHRADLDLLVHVSSL